MDSLLEWLKTWDWNSLLAVIISFVSVYGGSILVLVIGLIKTRLRNVNFQEAIEKKSEEDKKEQRENQKRFEQGMLAMLKSMENRIIQNNNTAHQERLQVLKDALGEADVATAELQEIPVEETKKDADAILNGLED